MFSGFFSNTMYYVFSMYYYILVQILQPPPHSFTIEKQACTYTKLLQDASQYKTTHCTQKHHLQPQSLLQPSATTRHQTIILFGMNLCWDEHPHANDTRHIAGIVFLKFTKSAMQESSLLDNAPNQVQWDALSRTVWLNNKYIMNERTSCSLCSKFLNVNALFFQFLEYFVV